MSIQRLSEKKTQRISFTTGLDVIRAWTTGDNNVWQFVTRAHEHGTIDERTDAWSFQTPPSHMSTCHLIDPSEPTGYRETE